MAEPTSEGARPTRRELAEARQREADERARQARSQEKMKKGAIIGLLVLALLVAVGYVVRETAAPLPGTAVTDEGRGHVDLGTKVDYRAQPPASGSHYPSTAEWKAYFDQQLPPEYYVHNLEHGGVALVFNCAPAACESLKANINGLYRSLSKSKYGTVKLVATQDSTLPEGQIWLLAWARRQMLDKWDQNEVSKFYEVYKDHGPEDAP